MGQEVGWTFSGDEQKKEQGWSFSAPPQPKMIMPGATRVPLEVPKRPGILPAIGEALKKTGQQIIAPVEAGVRMAAGIPAFLASTAATLGGQAITGDWEKGAEIGGKVGSFLGGGESRLGGEQTANVEQMLSPLMAPLNIAMEQGPELLAPNEPRTQAALRSVMALAMVLAPKLGMTPKTLIREARMTFWKDKSIPVQQKAAIIADLNKAEAGGAKTMAEVIKKEPPVGPKIKTTPGGPQKITLYRGGKPGNWYTPDESAARGYNSLDVGGRVEKKTVSLNKIAEPADVLKIAEELGLSDAPEQAAYWLISPEAYHGADAILLELKNRGYDAAHLPMGEDFAPSGAAIESYRLIPKAGETIGPKIKTITQKPPVAKEPWQMTKKEFSKKHVGHGTGSKNLVDIYKNGLKSGEADDIFTIDPETYGSKMSATPMAFGDRTAIFRKSAVEPGYGGRMYPLKEGSRPIADVPSGKAPHKYLVQQALSEGKSVPPEVLADYPDLAKAGGPIGPKIKTEVPKAPVVKEPWRDDIYTQSGKVEEVPIEWLDRLKEIDRRKQPKFDVDELKQNIADNGLKEPLILTIGIKDGTALLGEGNTRLAALKELGYTKVPIRIVRNQEARGIPIDMPGVKRLLDSGEHVPGDMRPSQVFDNLVAGEPIGPKIKTEVPKAPVERRVASSRPTQAAWDERDYSVMDDADLKKIEANIVRRFDPEEVASAAAELDRRMEAKIAPEKAPAKPVKPLSITSNQMKMGIEDFNKTMAEQGEGLLGEPRGGGIPVGMLKKGESPLAVELPKRIGPINLERLDVGEPVKKLVADMEDRITMSRVQSGRKNVPWSESEAMANSMGGAYEIGQVLGKTAEEVLTDFGKSTKNLEAKVEATRTIFKTAIAEAQKAAKEAVDNPSPLTEAKAQMAYNRWALVQYSVGQGSGEIGRALNIHKKLARSKEMILTKNYARMLKELGHDKLTPEAMQLLASFDEQNPIVAMKFLANARKATTKEKLFEVWINSILANPGTHVVNFTSNMLFEGMSPGERLLGAGVEFAKHPFKAAKRELYFGEAAHSIVGAFHGMKEGLGRYAYTIKHGVAKSGVSKFEETGIAPRKAIKGVKGDVVRFPGTELMANDDLWKAVIYSDDIYAQAYRAATKEGLRGDVRKAKMAELIANPTEAMSEAANNAARTRTFQAELGKLGKDFMRMRSRPGVAGTALNFVFPFVRTPINVVKEGLKRTPAGFVGIDKLLPAERSMQTGRVLASTFTAALIAKLVADGKITGSAPTNGAEREALYNTGWRPYSIKIGDTYYSYGRIEPIATQIGVVADSYPVYEMMKTGEWPKVAAKIGTAFRNNIANKTFLTGMTDVINATTDPGRYGELVIKRWATSLVPASGLLGGVARAIDPEVKDARKVIDWYKARLPLLSKQVPPKLNIMGQPQKTGGGALTRLLSPVAVSKETNDPVYTELARLGISIGPMKPVVGGKRMSPEQTRALITESGPEIKKAVSNLLASPLYRKQTDANKKKMLKSWITKTRAYQKGLFILENK